MSATPPADAARGTDLRLFDTHCHLNHFETDSGAEDGWRDAWTRARAAGVHEALIVGVDAASSRRARAIVADAGPSHGLRWCAGLHPTEARDFDHVWPELEAMFADDEPAAVGETGFDFHWDKSTPRQQQHAFAAQLAFAHARDLPVVIHCREAFDATFDLLEAHAREDCLPRGVMHCFSGGPDEARRALDLGLMLSFAGPLTYPRADALRAAAAAAPADRVLVETDAPFLPPQGRRGRRNEPAWVVHVAARLAEVRGTTTAEIARTTTRNARSLFGG